MKGFPELFHIGLLLFCLVFAIDFVEIVGSSVDNHLELGKKFLATGKLQDALSQYHAAVDKDPSNYLTFFKRAIVYIAMERGQQAVSDLNRATDLKPDFVQAKLQRAKVYLKQGKLDQAQSDFQILARDAATRNEADQHLEKIEPLKQTISNAKAMMANQDYSGAVHALTVAIESCPWDPILRNDRANCHMALDDKMSATGDIRRITRLTNDNTDAYYKLTNLLYETGYLDDSLQQVRECLKLDPEHKQCYPFYKKVKKFHKQFKAAEEKMNNENYKDAIPKLKNALKSESKVSFFVNLFNTKLCMCFLKTKNLNEGIETCTKALEGNENDIDVLCNRAELYLLNEQYDEAIGDYQKAKSHGGNNNRVNEGLNKANKLLKQSQRKDYYKILGVKRTATKREILKAYRKLAVKWHPDNYKGTADKKQAENKFIDIATAKEVLSDAEKRQRYDNGEDPLNPEAQQPDFGGFPGGGFPFGGEGFNFKFHFGGRH